jgi:hypothetical protein
MNKRGLYRDNKESGRLENLAFITSGVSFVVSAWMYALNAFFNEGVNPIAVGALVLNCFSWLFSGLADDRSKKFETFTLIGYFFSLGILGVWWLAHLQYPNDIISPPVRLLTSLLSVLSALNAVSQFLKANKQLLTKPMQIRNTSQHNNESETQEG